MSPSAKSLRDLYRKQREAIAAEIAEKDERDKPRWTYQEIADRRSISRERVRQIAVLFGLERRKQVSQPAEEAIND